MVVEVGRDPLGFVVVRRVLHRAEVPDLVLLGDDHQTAGVLAGGTLHVHTAHGQPGLLSAAGLLAPLGEVFFDVAEGGLVRHAADGAGAEDVGLAEHFHAVSVRLGLVFAGEVQIDVGNLVAAEAQEGLKRDGEAVLLEGRSALGADRVRQVRAAVAARGHLKRRVLAVRVGAAVVRRQRVDLRDAGKKRHQRRAHGAAGADQITVLQRVLHQLLGGNVDHVVMAVDDVAELRLDALGDELGRVVAVEAVQLAVDQRFEVLHRVLDLWRVEIVRRRTDPVAHIGNQVRVLHHDLLRFFPTEVGEFFEHFVGRAEIERIRPVAVLKALGSQ